MTEHAEESLRDQLNNPMAGPAKPRDEVAIRHRRAYAITEADDLLRALFVDSSVLLAGHRDDIRRVRGLLAEWRLESD